MNDFIDRCRAQLARTPSALSALLAGQPDTIARQTYGPRTFSPRDVVGHLLEGERTDWLLRLRIIARHGTSVPFDPYDHRAVTDVDPDGPIDALLETFANERHANLRALHDVTRDLDAEGIHPDFGAVSVRNLVASWVAHDLHHIAQICKGLVYPYREEMGPWAEHMGLVRSVVGISRAEST